MTHSAGAVVDTAVGEAGGAVVLAAVGFVWWIDGGEVVCDGGLLVTGLWVDVAEPAAGWEAGHCDLLIFVHVCAGW